MYLRSEILVNVNETQEEAYLLRAYVSAFLFRGYYDWYKLCKDTHLRVSVPRTETDTDWLSHGY